MNEEIKLPEHLIKLLQNLPESGMGYQIVDLILKNGTKLKKITILNSSIALLETTDKNIINEIVDIKLSQK